MEELRVQTQEKVTRLLASALPDAVETIVNLSKSAEKEDVKFRAANRILEEFSDRAKFQSIPGSSVQIVNAIQLERSAYVGKTELKTVEVGPGNLRIAMPVRKKIVPEGDRSTGKSIKTGDKMKLDTDAMGGHAPEKAMARLTPPDYVPPASLPGMPAKNTEFPVHDTPPKRKY